MDHVNDPHSKPQTHRWQQIRTMKPSSNFFFSCVLINSPKGDEWKANGHSLLLVVHQNASKLLFKITYIIFCDMFESGVRNCVSGLDVGLMDHFFKLTTYKRDFTKCVSTCKIPAGTHVALKCIDKMCDYLSWTFQKPIWLTKNIYTTTKESKTYVYAFSKSLLLMVGIMLASITCIRD